MQLPWVAHTPVSNANNSFVPEARSVASVLSGMKRFVFVLLVKVTHYHTVKEILKLTKIFKAIITKVRTVELHGT